MMKLMTTFMTALMLVGCTTRTLYDWGEYEGQLYASYKDPSKIEAMRVGLESHLETMRARGLKVAPGLYAELGTLYLQSGSTDQAIAMYVREREEWPESHNLMNAMIATLERRNADSDEVAQ